MTRREKRTFAIIAGAVVVSALVLAVLMVVI